MEEDSSSNIPPLPSPSGEDLGMSLEDMGKQYSVESTKTLHQLEELKKSYDTMRHQFDQIRKSTNIEDYKSLSRSKAQLAQLLGNIEKLQFNKLDAVSTFHLESGKTAAKMNRRELNAALDELQTSVTTLYKEYDAKPRPSSPPTSPVRDDNDITSDSNDETESEQSDLSTEISNKSSSCGSDESEHERMDAATGRIKEQVRSLAQKSAKMEPKHSKVETSQGYGKRVGIPITSGSNSRRKQDISRTENDASEGPIHASAEHEPKKNSPPRSQGSTHQIPISTGSHVTKNERKIETNDLHSVPGGHHQGNVHHIPVTSVSKRSSSAKKDTEKVDNQRDLEGKAHHIPMSSGGQFKEILKHDTAPDRVTRDSTAVDLQERTESLKTEPIPLHKKSEGEKVAHHESVSDQRHGGVRIPISVGGRRSQNRQEDAQNEMNQNRGRISVPISSNARTQSQQQQQRSQLHRSNRPNFYSYF